MLWLGIACVALFIFAVVLLIKLALLRRAAAEIRHGLTERLAHDTNTLIAISSNDPAMRKLADSINKELRLLRKERRRFQGGDLELKEAITNISHDLRTPLTAIYGYLDLLEKEEKSKDAARYISYIENRTLVLKQLTEELFRYSVMNTAPEGMRREDVNINSVLEESIAAHYMAFQSRGITPAIQMPENSIVRRLNHAALSRVFGNILSNALKYSDGDLDISLSETGEVLFSNTASRLDELQVGKLFNRFYTVEAARNATGLGLAIAKTLVEQMGGAITARYGDAKLSIRICFPDDIVGERDAPYAKT